MVLGAILCSHFIQWRLIYPEATSTCNENNTHIYVMLLYVLSLTK